MRKCSRLFLGLVLLISIAGAGHAQTQYLPQLAVGGSPEGSHFRALMFLSNSTATTVSGSCQFYGSDGLPLRVLIGGEERVGFDWTLGAGQSLRHQLLGRTAAIESGWARVTPVGNRPVNASLVYQLFDGATLISEAGVLGSPSQNEAAVLFDTAGGVETGLAIANISDQASSVTVVVEGADGNRVGSPQTIDLQRFGHHSRFLSEIFPGVTLPASGSILMGADLPFSAVALRITNYTKLATVPVAPSTRLRGGVPELLEFVSPDNGNRLQTIDPLVLRGYNLVNAVRLLFEPSNSQLQATMQTTSDTQVTGRVVIGEQAPPGNYRLRVVTRNAGIEQVSNALIFRVNTPCP